jgi:hypothetical protein
VGTFDCTAAAFCFVALTNRGFFAHGIFCVVRIYLPHQISGACRAPNRRLAIENDFQLHLDSYGPALNNGWAFEKWKRDAALERRIPGSRGGNLGRSPASAGVDSTAARIVTSIWRHRAAPSP